MIRLPISSWPRRQTHCYWVSSTTASSRLVVHLRVPLRLKERLGHFDINRLAEPDSVEVLAAFSQKPALHRFPRKFAALTGQLAAVIVSDYGGDAGRIWREADTVDALAQRLLDLPAFGIEKTNWTVGMLGALDMLSFDGWQEYRATPPKKRRP